MTINEAIAALTKLAETHDPITPLYFDCPHCLTSFAPSRLVTQAVHMKQVGTADDAPRKETR